MPKEKQKTITRNDFYKIIDKVSKPNRNKCSALSRYTGLIIAFLLALCVMVFVGCTNSVPSSQGLGTKVFDFTFTASCSSNETSLNFFIKLRGENNKLLGLDGTLSVKLWELDAYATYINKDNHPVQKWDNILVSKDDFVDGAGIPISLSYKGFTPLEGQFGYIMVTFTTDDTSMTAEGSIYLMALR
jgi:hypothetical protein